MKTSPVLASLDVLRPREFVRILICGDLGSGRSAFARSFEDAIIIDASRTLYEQPDRPDVPILRSADPSVITSLTTQINEGLVAPKTLVLHGLPFVTEFIEREEQHIKGYDGYIAVRDRLLALMETLQSVRANLVVTTRSKQEYARPGQVFGGKLITEMDRIILGSVADVHKALVDRFDIIFEMIRGTSSQPMAAVKNSTLRDLSADEVVIPDGKTLLERLTVASPTIATAPSPEAYSAYLRLRRDVETYGIELSTLGGIRDRACAKERTSKYLSAAEIEDVSVRFIAFLCGHDPLELEPATPIEESALAVASDGAAHAMPVEAAQGELALEVASAEIASVAVEVAAAAATPVDAVVAEAATSEDVASVTATPPIAAESVDSQGEGNVVSITAKATASVPSPASPEWSAVKDALTQYNVLLEAAGRADEIIPTVTGFIRANNFYDEIANDQVLAKAEHATAAADCLRARIAEMSSENLRRAS